MLFIVEIQCLSHVFGNFRNFSRVCLPVFVRMLVCVLVFFYVCVFAFKFVFACMLVLMPVRVWLVAVFM